MYEKRDNEFIAWYPNSLAAISDSNDPWKQKEAAFYVHIPFCSAICDYCGFSIEKLKGANTGSYLDCLLREIAYYRDKLTNYQFICGHFGGGTPSAVDSEFVAEVMRHLRANLLIESAAEVTIEVNPISATEAKLESYLRDGFNRLSVGIQSFNDPQLKVMGRPHRQSDVESLLSIIAKQKWINWSVDIMFGIPGQTLKDVEGDIRRLIEIAPPHISCFRLEVIPFTVLKLREFAGLLPQRLSEQTLLEMQELITCMLESAGYRHYGAFNYALPGFESVHNKIAFTAPQGEYIGFGNSAYSYINDAIYCNHADIDAYTSAVVSAGNGIVLSKAVSSREKMSRYFVLGLKFFEVSRSRFIDIFGIDPAYHFGDALTKLASEDLIDIQGDIYTLTKKGKYYVNNVCKEFYTDENKNRSQFPQFAPTITRKQVEKYASLASQK